VTLGNIQAFKGQLMKKIQTNALWVLTGIALTVAAIFGYDQWAQYQEKTSPKAQALELVRQHLNDPDSAKFEGVQFFAKTHYGCGSVNAKNRMGGYVGFTQFIANIEGKYVRFMPKEETSDYPPGAYIKSLDERIEFLKHAAAVCTDNPK